MLMSRIVAAYKEGGVFELSWRGFSWFYKHMVRPSLPVSSPIRYAGITVGFRKIGDGFFLKLCDPPLLDDILGYEFGLVSALKATVKKGDVVVVVGGGRGVTAITAAQMAAETGRVICFEGDLVGANAVMKAASMNGVAARLTVNHAIVGQNIQVWGTSTSRIIVLPSELPLCDVLELDCEGAELAILREMRILPRVIAVETHGFLGSSTSAVHEAMEALGYQVADYGWAEPRLQKECSAGDIRVLVGTR
jgi:hypothetical protein